MIEIRDIQKSFGEKTVLQKISFDIIDGETIVIIGKSGCGKTVLLKILLGLITPDGGNTFVDGKNIHEITYYELQMMRKKFGMLFQSSALFDSLSVSENVGLALQGYKELSQSVIQEKIQQALAFVEMEGADSLMPSQLSGGMQKRVALARAIVTEPQYILFDEPTVGLDPITADVIVQLILKLKYQRDVTLVIVTHDMKVANSVADRIAMLDGGEIVFLDSPEKFQLSNNIIVQAFISGNSQVNYKNRHFY